MPPTSSNFLSDLLRQNERQLMHAWVTHQLAAKARRADLMKPYFGARMPLGRGSRTPRAGFPFSSSWKPVAFSVVVQPSITASFSDHRFSASQDLSLEGALSRYATRNVIPTICIFSRFLGGRQSKNNEHARYHTCHLALGGNPRQRMNPGPRCTIPVWSKNPIRMKSKDDGSRGPCGPDGA